VKLTLNFMPAIIMLFIVFLILKLTGTITWSWIWVTSPLWISAGIMLIVGFGILMFLGICFIAATFLKSKPKRFGRY